MFSKLCFSCSHIICFVVNPQCTYIYCIIDFLYCSNCNPMFILSCFFHICTCCTWPHVAHFHVSECTNTILLLTSGRITECDKPLITDDDMFLTRQLLDSYTSHNFISIVFQMCKKIINYVYTKKNVKHPHVFLKWQMIRQVSRDYWPNKLNNAIVTC